MFECMRSTCFLPASEVMQCISDSISRVAALLFTPKWVAEVQTETQGFY